jgi:acyl dehydratase
MTDLLYFDDVQPGDVWKSPARTITETDVVNFAGLSGDYTSLHVDHHYASETPFRRPIAHGLLGLSLLAGLSSRCPNMATLALVRLGEWQFLKPIYFGDTVHAVTEILEMRPRGRRRGTIVWSRRLVNQDDVTVQSGTIETLVEVAAARRQPAEGPRNRPSAIPHPDTRAA